MQAIVTAHKKVIIDKWYQAVLVSYPPETVRFLRGEGDQFANPVGTTIYRSLQGLVEEILGDSKGDKEKITTCLDAIIRIRAIQDFTPSAALAFILQLKPVVRGELAAAIQEKDLSLAELDRRIDDLALMAFDIYMQCREQLYAIRVKEIKARTSRLLQRANLSLQPDCFSDSETDRRQEPAQLTPRPSTQPGIAGT